MLEAALRRPPPAVLHAIIFYPRGGSAQVVRYLMSELQRRGWACSLASGSLGSAGEPTHAGTFYRGRAGVCLDYTGAYGAADPLRAVPPLHPSFEDRPGAPDRIFARVDDPTYEHLVASWCRALIEAGAPATSILHLHHLTPLNEAARRVAPSTPRVVHLHGTELLMLEAIDAGGHSWPYAARWATRLRRWAREATVLLVQSGDVSERAAHVLELEPARFRVVPNGVELTGFRPQPISGSARRAFWRSWLVEEPRGWDESGVEGSISYDEREVSAFCDAAVVLLYVGGFTEIKRLPLLLRAYARAKSRFRVAAPLVLVGGHPGEWEGEHPYQLIREERIQDVFLAGWRDHSDLSQAMNAADALVLASPREQFGQVLLEAMACGLPAVAADAYGPRQIIANGETGWLVAPDDERALAEALVEVVNAGAERIRRGSAAAKRVAQCYGWGSVAAEVSAIYDEISVGPGRGGESSRMVSPIGG